MASLSSNDRLKQVKEFDDTKLGVKGLVDSGITQIPPIFRHPRSPVSRSGVDLNNSEPNPGFESIPVIDLLGPTLDVVGQVREAAHKFGFFYVINHGVPVSLLDQLVNAVKGFHELPDDERKKYYKRGMAENGVNYFSNFDLYHTKAAGWRDSLQLRLAPIMPHHDAIPQVCRNEVIEWGRELEQLSEKVLGLFSQGLGVNANKLKEMSCSGERLMIGQYYPYCPEPNETFGIKSHTDGSIFTVLLQGHVGGLQVKHDGKWVDVKPIHGALVINVGDLLQIISNDKYTSVVHRVNPGYEPRVSIVVFVNPSLKDNLYGPLPGIVSAKEPALYRQFTFSEFRNKFMNNELDEKLTKFFTFEHK